MLLFSVHKGLQVKTSCYFINKIDKFKQAYSSDFNWEENVKENIKNMKTE